MTTIVLDFMAQHVGYVGFAFGLFCGVPFGMIVLVLIQIAGCKNMIHHYPDVYRGTVSGGGDEEV